MVVKRQLEPLLWLLFSAGGVFAALLMPSLLLLFGLAFPLRVLAPPSYEHLRAVLSHPFTLLVLFFLCTLSLFHWAHRFRYTLYDGLQIKHLNEVITVLCYGGAIIGSVAAAYLMLRLGMA
jgi:fumarate reductase subunit D